MGEGTHRFNSGQPQTNQSGASPVPRQPPHCQDLAAIGTVQGQGTQRHELG